MVHPIPNPAKSGLPELQRLVEQPRVAWPTIGLFLVSALVWIASTTAAVQGHISAFWAILLNALASYWFFTVFHDAAHRALGQSQALNDWLGRISILPFSPFPIFRAFRFIHMQHHRHANEPSSLDPDAYTGEGPKWLLPLRWMTVDLNYYRYYLSHWRTRPRSEFWETVLAFLFGILVLAGCLAMGWWKEMLLYWILPGRIAMFFLALAFDYLPHQPKLATQQENPWQATNNRIGLEWLMTPLLLWQNYHLVHHLYPRAPFYRYIRIWKAGEPVFRKSEPLLMDWRGRILSHES